MFLKSMLCLPLQMLACYLLQDLGRIRVLQITTLAIACCLPVLIARCRPAFQEVRKVLLDADFDSVGNTARHKRAAKERDTLQN